MKKRKMQEILPPVLLGLIVVVLLQSGVVHRVFGIKVLQLPLPFSILSAFWENQENILMHSVTTLVPAVCGLVLGSLIGYGAALFVTAFPTLGYGSLFLITMVNSVPIVALAPLMKRWFESDFSAKLVVITIVSTGAMTVNAFRGLNDLPQNVMDLMHANAASKGDIFRKLRIPNSLPSVFTALKTGIPASMLATIIGEFFSSETSGLGYMIKYSLKVGNRKQIGWAYIIAVSLFSILLYGVIRLAEKHVLRWHVSQKK